MNQKHLLQRQTTLNRYVVLTKRERIQLNQLDALLSEQNGLRIQSEHKALCLEEAAVEQHLEALI